MAREPNSRRSSLSDEQSAYLITSGAFTPEELRETQASIARGELSALESKTRTQGLAASLSAAETATRLGADVRQVEKLEEDGTLFAFALDGESRYPMWQFTDDKSLPIVPGLSRLREAFPTDMHPASILGFMSTPQDGARIDGVPVTPVDWLLNGEDPQVLKGILGSHLMT